MALREAPRADPLATRVAWRVRAADIVLRKKFFADKRKELLKLFRDAPAKYRSPSGFAYFAYEVVMARTSDEDMAGLDLSGAAVLINGAERVQGATIRRFNMRFGRFGLPDSAMRTTWGMAEATV